MVLYPAVARAMRWTGGYGALPLVGKFKGTGAGGFLNEVTAFSVAAPLFDGRLPKGQDYSSRSNIRCIKN